MSHIERALPTVRDRRVSVERRTRPRPSLRDAVRSRAIAVIIATRGRADIVEGLVERLAEQSQPPEHIFVVGASRDDVAGLGKDDDRLTVHVGRAGSASQRNDGLALAGSRFDYIVFFDDDFVPSRYWIERMTRLFESRPDVAGVTGAVLADGASTAGVALADATAIVGERDSDPTAAEGVHDHVGYGGNTGCNMAFRYSAIGNLTFDERLPAYAWLEDADFRARAADDGRFVRADELWGVHLGHKQGRGRGAPLGYSQIANAVYLARKGTVPPAYLARVAVRNLLSNTLHAFRPEPFIDRRGRLAGNLVALADLIRGRIAPERALAL